MHERLNQQPATAWISAWIGYICNIGLGEQNCNDSPDGWRGHRQSPSDILGAILFKLAGYSFCRIFFNFARE
ncbi:hypothetical protein GFL18_10135 [Rhizobium leguminosarum bv. viciae]|nr:hypothetical protein [Rhizobium leguminosarum bv. viciae]